MNPFQIRMDTIHANALQLLEKAKTVISQNATDMDDKAVNLLACQLEAATKRLATEVNTYLEKCQASTEQVLAITDTQIQCENSAIELKELLKGDLMRTSELPKLQLPTFDGDILKYQNFWDRFQAAVATKRISDCDKLSYLLGCLQGPALDSLEGLGPNNKNYSVAMGILKERYGSKDKLIDAHYMAINNLKKANTIAECRNVLNAAEKHIRILGSLGENMEGNQFRAILTSKFPQDLGLKLNLMCDDKSLLNTRKALEKIITAMEFSNEGETASTSGMTTASLHVSNEEKPVNKRGTKRKFNDKTKGKKADSSEVKKPKKGCLLCTGPHYASDCDKITDIEEKKRKLGNRCRKCLRLNHRTAQCKSKRRCYRCRSTWHHEIICTSKSNTINKYEYDTTVNVSYKIETFMQTAVVKARSNPQQSLKKTRLLLDSGSQRTYVSGKLAKELGLEPKFEETLIIYTFGKEEPQQLRSPTVELELITRRNVHKKIQANIVPHITSKIPVPVLPKNIHIDLAADDGSAGEEVQILIGNDYFFSFIRKEKIRVMEDLFLINSDCGWMVSGKMKENKNQLSIVTYCQDHGVEADHLFTPDVPLRVPDIRFLWSLESIGIADSPKISRDEETIHHFNQTVKFENGRYHVKWPWITYPPDLTTNLGMAYGRLGSLWKRLDEPLKMEYDSIIKEQLQMGIIEQIEPGHTDNPVHYLPHHIVKQENKRGRIVYDASAKAKGQKSLNENMYRGPAMIEDLTALLLQFRLNKIGVTADVEKAFLAVGLQTEDRDVTRFLWLKNPNEKVTEENIIHMRFCRVPFGIVASPFILAATIQYHFMKHEDPRLREIAQKFYVDNLTVSTRTTNEAHDLITRTREAFNDISMNIRDWNSNDRELMKSLPQECRSKDLVETKVLGLTWSLKDDTLKLRLSKNLSQNETPSNKRELLSVMASVYDPCGLVAPLVLPAKLLVQELWKKKYKWDQVLPEELHGKLEEAITHLRRTADISVPRFVGLPQTGQQEFELHGFTDASNSAYAAAIYLRVYDEAQKQYKVSLMMAKSRVTPINHKEDLKIPKLELLGYLIGKRLLCYVKNTLKIPIKRLYLWTDSLIVLYWMKSEKLLPPFVARRVNEIKDNTEITHRYVNTHLNPADLATRPELWEEKREIWLNGPEFMHREEGSWPTAPNLSQVNLQVVAEGLDCNLCDSEDIVMEEPKNNSPEEKEENRREETDAEMTDMEGTRQIKLLQEKYFPEETKGKETCLKRNLGLFMDVDGLIRCQGRMTNTGCPYDMKHPILIPRECDFTQNLIKSTHEGNKHVGANHTLSIIRQKYWIPGGKGSVQRVIRQCPKCVKHSGGPYKLPPTPALPAARANYSAPFTYTGIDYFGPVMVKDRMKTEKLWVCLYTCLAVRAVHLEVVNNMTADECIMALRRFIATRGVPEVIVSDNAQQFRLTAEVLADRYCIENKIRWKFIPCLSPWYGGYYERLVSLVKNCLKRTLGKHLLNQTQLHTILKEIEAVLNMRPLTQVGSDIEYILKPADFLTFGKNIEITPAIEKNNPGGSVTKDDLVKGWKKGLVILDEFKKMFLGQYLCSLRERYQNSPKQPRVKSNKSPKVGDMIQIKGESKNREMWRVGKIKELIRGQDGECRVAKIDVEGKTFIRSIGHLYPLEIGEDNPITRTHITDDKRTSSTTHDHIDLQPNGILDTHLKPTNENEVSMETDLCAQTPTQPDEDQTESMEEETPTEAPIEVNEEVEAPTEAEVTSPELEQGRPQRQAAQRAKEKIAVWASQLQELLCL